MHKKLDPALVLGLPSYSFFGVHQKLDPPPLGFWVTELLSPSDGI